ncbi:MAG: hypothetical protein WC156_16325, partial [Pedobacter sp.]
GSYGKATRAPPNERGGNRQAKPTVAVACFLLYRLCGSTAVFRLNRPKGRGIYPQKLKKEIRSNGVGKKVIIFPIHCIFEKSV